MDLLSLNLTALIVFLVPGFIANRLYRAYYPVKTISDSNSVISSLISSLWIYAIIKLAETRLNFSLNENLDKNPSANTTIILLLAAYVWGILRIVIHKLKEILATRISALSFLYPDPGAIWPKVASHTPTNWAKVKLTDGTCYLGWISHWKYDPDIETQDFLLSSAKRVDDLLNITYEVSGIGVYLKTSDIISVEFYENT